MQNFTSFNLPEKVLSSLSKMNFQTPTPIQAQVIPLALEGKDILGSAQTGTGKTGAFAIPAVSRLVNNPNMRILVLTPTRELAVQVCEFFKDLTNGQNNLSHILLLGGEPIFPQLKKLKSKPRIIVGTPGRINDHLSRKSLNLSDVEMVVIDETDRMLDMGFGIQIESIMKCLPTKRQTLMFSATFPAGSIKLAEKYMHKPERIAVGKTNAPTLNIDQKFLHTPHAKKYQGLVQELTNRTGSVIVFVNTRRGAETLAQKLKDQSHSVNVLHGNLQQNKRKYIINDFRKKSFRIMVATDVAARGLDVPHIEHVINYELPNCPEDYVHRIGRTGRAEAKGCAVSLVTPEETGKWKRIKKFVS
jgi:superfamily II DNA/RNA helicase